MYGIASVTTLITVSVVGGLPFIIVALLLSSIYYNGQCFQQEDLAPVLITSLVAKVYGQTSRDMRRLGRYILLVIYLPQAYAVYRLGHPIASILNIW